MILNAIVNGKDEADKEKEKAKYQDLMDYLIPYNKDGDKIATTPTLVDALVKLEVDFITNDNGTAKDPKTVINDMLEDKVDEYLTDDLFDDIKEVRKYVRIARIVLEDSVQDAFDEILDVLEEENPLPELSQKIQDAIPVIGPYFNFSTYDEASKKVTTLITIPVVLIPILIAFFTILVVACKCICCTKCQICMASCGCSLLCAFALIMPIMASLPNAFIQPNMDAIQNELQTTTDLVLERFKLDPVEIEFPESTNSLKFTYANGTIMDRLTVDLSSIEALFDSMKFNIVIDIGEFVKDAMDDNNTESNPANSDEDDIMEIVKNHLIDVLKGKEIKFTFDFSGSDLNKVLSSDATPVLSYFKVKGMTVGKAFENKLEEVITDYFSDKSFFEVFQFDKLIGKVLTNKRIN